MLLTQTQIKQFINEDAPLGDITTQAVFNGCGCRAQANIVAKSALVVSGFDVVREVLKAGFPKLKLKVLRKDGSHVKSQATMAHVEGLVTDLLKAERLILNLLQHLSGVATLTDKFVKVAKPYRVQVLDTRKTTPGLRAAEKKAVLDGGGVNHRLSLSDQYLIKDNHIDAAGSITEAIIQVRAHQSLQKKKVQIEVEVRNQNEFLEALMLRSDMILLDNMSSRVVREMVQLRQKKCAQKDWPLLEVSGGVNFKNLKEYCKTGVERISIGALTHSAPAVDISMKIKN